jgi:glycolate dehydrogenase iron-sulfur subunit
VTAAFDLRGLERCIHCGLCLEACPTYRLTHLETESPRGRLHLMGAIGAGRVASADASVVHLDRCLACRACEAVCPSGVPYGRLIEATRAGLVAERPLPLGARILLWVVSRPMVLDLGARVLGLADRIGARRLVRHFLSPRLRRLDDLAPPMDRPRFQAVAVDAPNERVALLLGCVMRVSYGDIHTATARVLARAGVAIVPAAGQVCCGALAAHAGDRKEALRLARRNIDAFENSGAELVLVNAAGCGAHVKTYAHLLEADPEWRERAATFSRRVRDVSEYLGARIDRVTAGALPMRITYQDPCHLAHAQGIRAEPRALLRRVAGLELIEMVDADVCCGSAGYYNVTEPEYADRLLAPKIEAILETGAEAVVTANPGCMLQLQAGLRARGRADVAVLHVVEVLDRAIANP